VPDYYDVIKNPISLEDMLEKADRGVYLTLQNFVDDIHLIVRNAEEYNRPGEPQHIVRRVRHQKLDSKSSLHV
jgi:hypothetical protein